MIFKYLNFVRFVTSFENWVGRGSPRFRHSRMLLAGIQGKFSDWTPD
jgi:hypothetical protein